jgi:hypothetical protein
MLPMLLTIAGFAPAQALHPGAGNAQAPLHPGAAAAAAQQLAASMGHSRSQPTGWQGPPAATAAHAGEVGRQSACSMMPC